MELREWKNCLPLSVCSGYVNTKKIIEHIKINFGFSRHCKGPDYIVFTMFYLKCTGFIVVLLYLDI